LTLAVAVARRKRTLLLGQRAEGGLFGGLWELPSAEIGAASEGPKALLRLLGDGAWVGQRLFSLQRTLTHRDLELVLYEASVPGPLEGRGEYQAWQWVDPAQVAQLGMSSATRALLERVGHGPR
ncbi:MAG: NUDIX domain-containing protein, partial [Myxococcaceae bacterium]|nr:NUDIX domain-containing protein [Myxococcaceae bacterium]